MLRVLGTIKNSEYAGNFKSEQNDLINWVLEIQDGMYTHLVRRLHSCTTRPVIDPPSLTTAFVPI